MIDKNYLKTIRERSKKSKGNKRKTKQQLLADEVFAYFKGELTYPRIIKMINENGWQFVYETLNQIKQEPPKNSIAAFIYKCKQSRNEIKWL